MCFFLFLPDVFNFCSQQKHNQTVSGRERESNTFSTKSGGLCSPCYSPAVLGKFLLGECLVTAFNEGFGIPA